MTTERATEIIAGYDGCSYSSDPEERRYGGGLDWARRQARQTNMRLCGAALCEMYADLGAEPPFDGDELENGWAFYRGEHPVQSAVAVE